MPNPKAPPPPPDPQVLAASIDAISASLRKLMGSGLNRKAITVLVHYDTGISQREISAVFDSLDGLSRKYTSR